MPPAAARSPVTPASGIPEVHGISVLRPRADPRAGHAFRPIRVVLPARYTFVAIEGFWHRSCSYGDGTVAMIEFSVKPPTIPIPFHKLLKVVAIVDGHDPQTKELLDHIAAEHFEIEVSDSLDRDVSEDAAVGAYIALIDGERREKARGLAQGRSRDRLRNAALGAGRFASDCRHRGAGHDRRGRGLHLPRTADAGLLREAGRGEHRQVRDEPAAALLRRAHGLRRRRPTSPSTARDTRAVSSTGSRRRARSSSSTSARASSATICATRTWTSAIC